MNQIPVDCHGIPLAHGDPAFPDLGLVHTGTAPERFFDLKSVPGQVVIRYRHTNAEFSRFSNEELKSTYWSRIAIRVGYKQTITPTVEIVS